MNENDIERMYGVESNPYPKIEPIIIEKADAPHAPTKSEASVPLEDVEKLERMIRNLESRLRKLEAKYIDLARDMETRGGRSR